MQIIKVPVINGLGKTNGCELGGNAILKALDNIYSNENGKPIDIKKLDLEEIHVDNSNIQLSNDLIYKNSLEVFEENPKVIFLGGDHSATYSITKAFLYNTKKSEKNPCLIVFDAHADCMTPMNEPTHEEWLRKLINNGFPPQNILLVGARNIHEDEIKFLKEKNIKVISMNQLLGDLHDTCDIIMEFANNKELYVSIDIDIIDPVFAPATGYPESGGLSSREFIYLIQRINKVKTLRGIDIVEINPKKDKDDLTIKLGAKILGEFLG
jgi:agmatinase